MSVLASSQEKGKQLQNAPLKGLTKVWVEEVVGKWSLLMTRSSLGMLHLKLKLQQGLASHWSP